MSALPVAPALEPPLRRLPVPVAEPRPALRVVRRDDQPMSAAQGTLHLVSGASDAATGPTAEARKADAAAVAAFCAAVPTPTRVLPDARRWAGQFVQAAVEVAAGQRPASQLVRWTAEDVHTALVRRGRLAAGQERRRGPHRAVVHSVRVCSPGDGIVEACAVVGDRSRVRAVALRLEGLDGRWRVTALEIG